MKGEPPFTVIETHHTYSSQMARCVCYDEDYHR